MLSAPDADLSLRDPGLPGLPMLLDPVSLCQELAQDLPQVQEESIDLRATYLRYKPGTNCLAAYHLDTAGASLDLYAKAYPPDAWDKLRKGFDRPTVPAPYPLDTAPGRILLPNLRIVLNLFPNDKRLKSLTRLGTADGRLTLLQSVFRAHPELWSADVHTISYKPERRYVAQVLLDEEPHAVLKFYTEGGYRAAKSNAKGFNSRGLLRIAGQLGHSDRHRVLAFEWVHGQLLAHALYSSHMAPGDVQNVGAALAELHAQKPKHLSHLARRSEIDALLTLTSWLGFVCPSVAELARHLAARLAERLRERPELYRPIHGDFYAKQVLVNNSNVCMLDLDEAVLSDPSADLGLFVAHLERDVLYGKLSGDVVGSVKVALLEGYRANAGQQVTEDGVALYAAVGLLKLAPHPFRTCQPEWPQQTETILHRVEELLQSNAQHISGYRYRSISTPRRGINEVNVAVTDPFGVAGDPKMSFLRQALDPSEAEIALNQHLQPLADRSGGLRLRAIHVVRYKRGRRCLVQYDLEAQGSGAGADKITLLGKARARGLDETTYGVVKSLWRSGWGEDNSDGIRIPEPVGILPEFQMWLQRKLPGLSTTQLLLQSNGVEVARRVAEVAHKLHQANTDTGRVHTMADELRILQDYLLRVAEARPHWALRIDSLFRACELLGASIPEPEPTGIHRDFYPDQILAEQSNLYLLDLDLYCKGDPALDVGNFIGHLREMSLRIFNDVNALANREDALERRFIELSGCDQYRIQVYATLTLARHIYLSTQFLERRDSTEALLEECERSLRLQSRGSTSVSA